MAQSGNLRTKVLRRARHEDEYRAYRAALEWDLTDPIVIESRDDLKSEYRWRDRLEPYHHQVTNLITFCRRLPVTLLADDVGLGKTISAGLVLSELISRGRIEKILIVCPKLLGEQWREELQTKFDIEGQVVSGRKLLKAEPKETGAVITTYQSARMHLDAIPTDRFQMLILDEAHKLRNLYGTEKPPQVAVRFRKALEERRFRFVLMLTATPIHNRLWDIYSLVDLLTVARGHQNPFGAEGMFARRFIADTREQARQLRPEARDDFRSIVYGYMSRVRRKDAKLYFPDRVVQLHRVDPTPVELELISAVGKLIQKMNRLAQISILHALTSSPHALAAQLETMARNGTVAQEFAAAVRALVTRMPTSAKLTGLGTLIEKLKRENPDRWRLVIFTGRLETQTTIQAFLEGYGLKVGIINGSSGARNQETISRFRKSPPECRVIVSTEAGSEGINLQVANVLVNFDLPWNPMIVEQRIGRVQRLASEHASVGIFNIMLKGTFEEYIVGRLMEKLQMASHAIGDIEALLEASGLDGEDGSSSFDEKIRELVVAALAGKDVEKATRQMEQSIAEAKTTLEKEEKNIDEMLGGDGGEYVGPRTPTLPLQTRSLNERDFTLLAFKTLGARITPQSDDLYLCEEGGGKEYIRFNQSAQEARRSILYAAETPAFSRLVDRIVATGTHQVTDADEKPGGRAAELAADWLTRFGGSPKSTTVENVARHFSGAATIRVRATVAHDSYERLVDIPCAPTDHQRSMGQSGLSTIVEPLEDPTALGINLDSLFEAARLDPAISEFCRFYIERRSQEMAAAGGDARKRKKLEDEFTPRLEGTVVALSGEVRRVVQIRTQYSLDADLEYSSSLRIEPSTGRIVHAPSMSTCSKSGRIVPNECLQRCQVSNSVVLRHLLVQSEISERLGLPEFSVQCGLSGKRILSDEADVSAVTGRSVARALLRTSAVSGKRAEPEYFTRCEFTSCEVLDSELATSEFSKKRYRADEQVRSSASDKTGHKSEFVICHETRQPIGISEAETCESTGHRVRPGILEACAVTRKRVLPSELERCTVTGQRALKKLLVSSSVSGARLLEEAAVQSVTGKFCAPLEASVCTWSGRKCHPDDLRVCELIGIPVHFEFVTKGERPRLVPLVEMLDGLKRTSERTEEWEAIAEIVTSSVGGRCRVEAAMLSPNGRHLAGCAQVRTLLGLKTNHAGFIYSLNDKSLVGRIPLGKRTNHAWTSTRK